MYMTCVSFFTLSLAIKSSPKNMTGKAVHT